MGSVMELCSHHTVKFKGLFLNLKAGVLYFAKYLEFVCLWVIVTKITEQVTYFVNDGPHKKSIRSPKLSVAL